MQDPTILTFTGQKPGKTVAIFAGVHGNEVGGIYALRRLIDDFNSGRLVLQSGTLHLAFANLAAIALGVRFTQMNMNRAFHMHSADVPEALRLSYERLRAIDLQIILEKSDALLDLHSTLAETTPFIICETHSFHIAQLFPFEIISTGWDQVHTGSTDAYMNKQGKVGICIECGQHDDPAAHERARLSIEIFLREMGLVDTGIIVAPVSKRRIHARSIYRAKELMTFVTKRPEFAHLATGEIIGRDGDLLVTADRPSILLFPKEGSKAGDEAFVLGEEIPF